LSISIFSGSADDPQVLSILELAYEAIRLFCSEVPKLLTFIPIPSDESVFSIPKSSPPCVPDKQLRLASPNHCSLVQMPMADRVVFQMDQTKPSDQVVLWHLRECCENTNLIAISIYLCISGNHQKTTLYRPNAQPNSPSLKHYTF